MQTGNVLLVVTLTITLGAIAAYIAAGLGRREYRSTGRAAYIASAAAIVGISVYFMSLILGNHFELEYIFNNSSIALPLYYKVSVFWAGQQGSFLFWAFCGALLGIFVMFKSRQFEPWLMALWSGIQGLFLILMLIDSPFKSAVTTTGITDGQGLRELLQNPWMAIHPPLVFIGYAAMCLPAAFAIAALVEGDYRSWCKTTLPWAVFGWITLGAGIIVGAYWAYEVLGWGGYWGWDPVENASLIPWLTGTALLHGMIAERYRGSFRRANVIMALLTFLFIFYATFLTRSDALKDFSVHTFGDARIGGPLLYFMSLFAIVAAALMVWRWKKLESGPSFTTIKSKDFALFLAIVALSASAAFVLVGTSAPIIGKMASHVPGLSQVIPKQVKVDGAFYNKTNAPIAFVVLCLMALAPILAWKREKADEAQQGLGVIIAAVAVGLAFLALKMNLTALAVAIAVAALLALASNAYTLARTSRSGFRLIGGFATHVGMGILFLGVILSASGGASKTVMLTKGGKSVSSHGYTFAFKGTREIGQKKGLVIDVGRDGKTVEAVPTMQLTRERELLATPHIVTSFGRDLYIAPKSMPGPEEKVLTRGQMIPVQDFELKFVDFVTPAGHGTGDVRVGARLDARVNGKPVTVTPILISHRSGGTTGSIAQVPGMRAAISVNHISVEDRSVDITFSVKDGQPMTGTLHKDQPARIGNYELTFKQWRLPEGSHMGEMQVVCTIEVTSGGKTVTVEPVYQAGQGQGAQPQVTTESVPVPVPGADATIKLEAVDVNTKQVLVTVTPNAEMAVVDVSVKPFISLLWIGAILALCGGSIAMWRRNAESYGEPLKREDAKVRKTRKRKGVG